METEASADSTGTTDAPHRTRDGISGFRVGDAVRVRGDVRPRQYANRTGLVAALNVRDGEVGITFSSARSHDAAVWFEPDECVVEIGHTRHKAAQCHAKARPAVTDRELTAKRGAR